MTATFGGAPVSLTWSAVLQGAGVGLLVSLLFSLVPLLEVRRVKPLLLLRGGDASTLTRRRRSPVMAGSAARHRSRAGGRRRDRQRGARGGRVVAGGVAAGRA